MTTGLKTSDAEAATLEPTDSCVVSVSGPRRVVPSWQFHAGLRSLSVLAAPRARGHSPISLCGISPMLGGVVGSCTRRGAKESSRRRAVV